MPVGYRQVWIHSLLRKLSTVIFVESSELSPYIQEVTLALRDQLIGSRVSDESERASATGEASVIASEMLWSEFVGDAEKVVDPKADLNDGSGDPNANVGNHERWIWLKLKEENRSRPAALAPNSVAPDSRLFTSVWLCTYQRHDTFSFITFTWRHDVWYNMMQLHERLM